MNGILPYLLKSVLCAALLYGYYWIALRNRVFHQWNRFYLLLIVPASLLLPLARIEVAPSRETAPALPVRLLQVVSDGNNYVEAVVPPAKSFDPSTILYCIYTIVALALLLHFARGLWRLNRLAARYPAQRHGEVEFILAPVAGTPFSHFRRIFWNPSIDPSSANGQQILEHELVHVREQHSLDKLLLQAALVLCWFNPVFWLLRNELHLVHEFIADRRSVRDGDVGTLAALILQAAYPQQYQRLTNPFFHHAIKRRLYMLNQVQKARVQFFGRVAVLPLLAVIGFTFAIRAQQPPAVAAAPVNSEKFVVVIDAGHGQVPNGGWSGASSHGVIEDRITLAIAQRIKALNADPGLEIVLTRPDDANVDLKSRTETARRAAAGLFLSLHVDALEKDNIVPAQAPAGFCIYVPADSGTRTGSRLFGSVLQQSLGNVYPTDRELHTRNVSVWVLKNSPAPAALIEFGFINKDADRAFISQESNQDHIARELLNAIARYRLQQPARNQRSSDAHSPEAVAAVHATVLPADVVTPVAAKEPAPAHVPADSIQSIDVNSDRTITVHYNNGTTTTMSAAEAHRRGIVNPADNYAPVAVTARNPPRSLAVPVLPVVVNLRSRDTLRLDDYKALPLQVILSPEGYTLESCTLTVDLKNGDIQDATMNAGNSTEAMKKLQAGAWSGQTITVDARQIRTKAGELRKVPALVFYIK